VCRDFLLGEGLKATVEILRKFLRLPGREQRIVLQAAGGLAATRAGLALAGFRRWQQVLVWLTPTKFCQPDASKAEIAEQARAVVRLGEAVARNFPWRTNCLEQSLVFEWLLRRRGISATLRIGGRKDGDRFEAHAWVELEGAKLSGAAGEDLNYIPFEGQAVSLETEAQ
jgi:Transglutaminase-like superfamily